MIASLCWSLTATLTLTLFSAAATAQEPVAEYAAGQIWSYHHRPADSGSLVRIASIESEGDLKIYHVSLIGVKPSCESELTNAGHLPLSEQTMRQSLIAPVTTTAAFPDASEGIAEWRRAKGGVFTISLADVADVLDQSICSPDRVAPS